VIAVAERMDARQQWLACSRKQRYGSEESARTAMIRLWLDGRGDGLKVYRCRVPEQTAHWHIGHVQTYWMRRAGRLEEDADS
jgi:hypothetical protein